MLSRLRPFTVYISVIVLLLGSGHAIAQRIHVVVAGDLLGHPDPNQRSDSWRDCISADMEMIRNFFESNVDPSQLNIVRLASIDGANTPTKAQVFNAISSFNVASQDCIVFYYSGHGALSPSKGHFLALPNQERLYRSEITAAMRRRGAKLNVVLTDTCSNIVPDPPGQGMARSMQSTGGAPRVQTTTIIKKLFLAPRGIVDISGSAPDEYGTTMPGGIGSSFTVPLTNYFSNNQNRNDISWMDVVRDVTPRVAAAWKTATKGQPAPNGQMTQTVHAYAIAGLPRFGVRTQNLNGDGVIIREIQPTSPAKSFMINNTRYQLDIGDVIVNINGKPVRNEADYNRLIDLSGKRMKLTVRNVNDRQLLTGNITLRY